MPARVLIIGVPLPEHVGAHLLAAAPVAGVEATILDSREAWTASSWHRRWNWHLRAKLPTALKPFSARVLETCRSLKPDLLLATGIAPLSDETLASIGRLGIRRVNYLLDDPWNSANSAAFFWNSLRNYDTIYSVRTANLTDLRRHGCADVQYLPCAYNPDVHFPEQATSAVEAARFVCDLAFVGGCDEDRIALLRPVLRAGLKLNLYGGYWDRYAEARPHYKGFVVGRDLRLAVSAATVNLCIGRAANRDGHAMRSFELPAMGACMIVQDTSEHRAIFGPEGRCVHYYREVEGIIRCVRTLMAEPERAALLSRAAREQIRASDNTYTARLRTMLDGAGKAEQCAGPIG